MKSVLISKLALVFIMFCYSNEVAYGQCEPIPASSGEFIITPMTQNNGYKFDFIDSEEEIHENDLIIWYFGDGHYATGQTVFHRYKNTGDYPITVYKAKGPNPGSTIYVPEPPSIYRGNTGDISLTSGNGTDYGTSSTSLHSLDIQVNTTWNITPHTKNYHYFILTLTNNSNEEFSGTIELSTDEAISFDSGDCLLPNYVNRMEWYDLATLENTKPTITVSGLEAGETRQFYVMANLASSFNILEQPIIETLVEVYDDVDRKLAVSGSLRSVVSLHPHDPNSITVLQEDICPMVNTPQVLDKIIKFQNIGAFYAQDVKVLIFNSSFHQYQSIQVIDHSHAEPELVITGSINRINFFGIYLPGLDQVSPEQYAPSESIGWVHLRFTVEPCVNEHANIVSSAQIKFDSLAPIWTNEYSTPLNNRECGDLPLCDPVEDQEGDLAIDGKIRSADSGISDHYAVFPNPFQDHFQIEIPTSDSPISIQVFDMKGRKVHQENLSSSNTIMHRINSDSWQDGIYLIHIHQAGKSEVIKCIKQG